MGFPFALFAMSIGVISLPLLLDRDVGLDTAARTSIRAVRMNPGPMAACSAGPRHSFCTRPGIQIDW
jgi:uncharacterized membrane protein